jgi:CAAX protease family protein
MSDASSSIPQPRNSRRNSASTVIRALIGWLLLWTAGIFVAGAVVGAVYQPQKPPLQIVVLAMLIVSPALLFGATYRRAGFNRARLGLTPIKRKWLLALLSALLLAYVPAMYWLFGQPLPFRGIDVHREFWIGITMIASIIIVTPLAEELLFRGWLWSDLGEFWPGIGTMLFTGAVFWLAHALEGWQRLLGIALPTIVFTLARRYCDSVKASLWLHVLNNAAVVALLLYLVTRVAPVVVHLPPQHVPIP